jgi:hypothetical protein
LRWSRFEAHRICSCFWQFNALAFKRAGASPTGYQQKKRAQKTPEKADAPQAAYAMMKNWVTPPLLAAAGLARLCAAAAFSQNHCSARMAKSRPTGFFKESSS